MPSGGDPPDPGLPQAVFDALHVMSYDSTNWAFKDSLGKVNYMFVEKKPGGAVDQGRWFYGTDSEGQTSPRGQVPSQTFTIIKNGTYNPSSGLVNYSGSNYRFRLARDLSAGKQVAAAIAV